MKVLGIVGSQRKMGNTEILVKEALMGAEEEGAEVDILRLTDYKLLPCDGLAPCIFGNTGCNLDDDFNYLLERIYECDSLIFGAPCYILESTAVVKLVIDRMISVNYRSRARGKPAAVIVPYATRGWTPYAFMQPNILLMWLGMEVIDRALLLVQGMREALLYDKMLARVHEIGKRVAIAAKTGDRTYYGEPGLCPLCHDRNIRVLKDMESVECGVCGMRGKLSIENGKIKVDFSEEEFSRARFNVEHMWRHFTYHIKPSKDYFIRTRGLSKDKVKKYKEYLRKEEEPFAADRG